MGLCTKLTNFTEEKRIALLDFSAGLKDAFLICRVYDAEAVIVLAYLKSDCREEVLEAYTINKMSTDFFACH